MRQSQIGVELINNLVYIFFNDSDTLHRFTVRLTNFKLHTLICVVFANLIVYIITDGLCSIQHRLIAFIISPQIISDLFVVIESPKCISDNIKNVFLINFFYVRICNFSSVIALHKFMKKHFILSHFLHSKYHSAARCPICAFFYFYFSVRYTIYDSFVALLTQITLINLRSSIVHPYFSATLWAANRLFSILFHDFLHKKRALHNCKARFSTSRGIDWWIKISFYLIIIISGQFFCE